MHGKFGKSFISTVLYAQQLGNEMRAGGKEKVKSEQYRYNATRALRQDVKKQQMNGFPADDATIATVQMLYCLADAELAGSGRTDDNQIGSIEAMKEVDAHRRGLELLIRSRGGLPGLRDNRCLYAFIIM